jgi:formamidopyrimidine-DNA glycosylase
MPELPEVEKAMRRLRKAVEGKTIASVRALHPALARQLPEEKALLVATAANRSRGAAGKAPAASPR